MREIAGFALFLLWTANLQAQTPFYAGKTIRIIVGLVIKTPCKDLPEYRERFFEPHTMPGQVGCRLSRVLLSA